MSLPSPLDGLRGLRLALYDEALTAGPLGIGKDSLLEAVAPDGEKLAMTDREIALQWPEARAELQWLIDNHLLEWLFSGLLRARSTAAAVAAHSPRPEQVAAPTPPVAQLRTPACTPGRQGAQATFF